MVFSIYNNMKLLLENWKQYLCENIKGSKDYEKDYFGSNLTKLGNKLFKSYIDWRSSQPEDEQPQTSKFLKLINDPLLSYAGEGSFRIVFVYNDNIVFKLAKRQVAETMNKQESELGKIGKFSNLFPKVYASDKKHRWIAMEKCETIRDPIKFLTFFKNSYVDEILKGVPQHQKVILFEIMLQCQSKLITRQTDALSIALEKTSRVYSPFFTNLRRKDLNTGIMEIKKILNGYGPLFQELAGVVAELGIASYEIRPHNVGVAPDGRFVILDSSIQKTLEDFNY